MIFNFGRKKVESPKLTDWSEIKQIGDGAKVAHYPAIIDSRVNDEIEKYCHSELKKEVGGVLVGTDSGHLEIVGAVDAKYAEHQAASITFTHKSWEHIHAVMEARYEGLKIVGWFHTHPGYGIFLSSYDLFIHNNFFKLPYQVALVIDPCQDQRGLFAWKGEKVEKLSHYMVGRCSKSIAETKLELERADHE